MLFDKIQKIVFNAFSLVKLNNLGKIFISKYLNLSHFQCNDLIILKKNKNFKKISKKIIFYLKSSSSIKNIKITKKGFLNIFVSDKLLLEELEKIRNDIFFGIKQINKKKTILLDYGGPNIGKDLHVGHMRSLFIGDALKNIAFSLGYRTICDVHYGDTGLQIGLIIAELEDRFTIFSFKKIKISSSLLNKIYPYAVSKSEKNIIFFKKAKKISNEFYYKKSKYYYIWKKICFFSKNKIKKTFNTFNIKFDYHYGESDAIPYISYLLNFFIKKKILYKNEGAHVINVNNKNSKFKIPPVIIKKKDGGFLYTTTDLATLVQRNKKFKLNEIWYIVDKRQFLHFEQVFKVSNLTNLIDKKIKLFFLGFGTINDLNNKPYKTREGKALLLLELFEKIKLLIKKKILKSNKKNLNKKDILKIAVSSIKFNDLINKPTGNYIFNIKKFLSFNGKTGCYLLYNYVRIVKILNKLKIKKKYKINCIKNNYDRLLIFKILNNYIFLKKSFKKKSPNILAENTYQIALFFSKFYTNSNIINENNKILKDSWIGLLQICKKILKFNLKILGIKTLKKI